MRPTPAMRSTMSTGAARRLGARLTSHSIPPRCSKEVGLNIISNPSYSLYLCVVVSLKRLHVCFLEYFFVFSPFSTSSFAWSASALFSIWSAPSIVCNVASCMHPWLPDFWMCHEHPSTRAITTCCANLTFCTSSHAPTNLTSVFHHTHSYFAPFPSNTVENGGGNCFVQ